MDPAWWEESKKCNKMDLMEKLRIRFFWKGGPSQSILSTLSPQKDPGKKIRGLRGQFYIKPKKYKCKFVILAQTLLTPKLLIIQCHSMPYMAILTLGDSLITCTISVPSYSRLAAAVTPSFLVNLLRLWPPISNPYSTFILTSSQHVINHNLITAPQIMWHSPHNLSLIILCVLQHAHCQCFTEFELWISTNPLCTAPCIPCVHLQDCNKEGKLTMWPPLCRPTICKINWSMPPLIVVIPSSHLIAKIKT